MNIYFEGINGEEDIKVALGDEMAELFERAAVTALEAEGFDEADIDRCQLSLSVVDEAEIHRLNKEYRDADRATDVLSFPQFEASEELPEEGEICLGDVVICQEVAKRQAEEYGHSFSRELTYLFVHSILHLLGYDHMDEEEKGIMRLREEEIMERLSLTRP